MFYVGIITEFYIYEVKPDLEMEVLQKLSFRETKSHVDRGGGVPALSLKADSLLPSEHVSHSQLLETESKPVTLSK